ncbi:shikimate dehydrogenase [Microbacterium sp. GXF6406]
MAADGRTRLEVWGDPIAHSKSPLLHEAAYRVLGLDWSYERRQVDTAGFDAAFTGLDASWRGLSTTMPLKESAHRVADRLDRHAQLTGAVNTLVLGAGIAGYNTDVGGIIDAFAGADVTGIRSARVLGAGATAASAVVAAAEMGARQVEVRARRPERAGALMTLGSALGIDVDVTVFETSAAPVDATIATLPSGTVLDETVTGPLAADGGVLLDAAYAPWPSALASAWEAFTVISGLEMLLGQAVRQVRAFVNGDPLAVLDDEDAVRTAMRAALG